MSTKHRKRFWFLTLTRGLFQKEFLAKGWQLEVNAADAKLTWNWMPFKISENIFLCSDIFLSLIRVSTPLGPQTLIEHLKKKKKSLFFKPTILWNHFSVLSRHCFHCIIIERSALNIHKARAIFSIISFSFLTFSIFHSFT